MRGRVALIGVGRWGRVLLRIMHERVDVALCCNRRDGQTHSWVRERYPHVRSTFDFEEVLADNTIEAVFIATPIMTHALLVGRALEAGKHVFVEKPLATSRLEAARLVECAEKNDLLLSVGHVFLYHPVMRKLNTLTQYDPVVYTKMSWNKYGTFEEDIFWNLLCHEVSIGLELFGKSPKHSEVLHRKGIVTACDIVAARLCFDESQECVLEINRCVPTKQKSITVVTAGGEVFLWENDALFRVVSGVERQLIYEIHEEPLALEVEAFLRGLEFGVRTRCDGRFGLRIVEVVDDLVSMAKPC